VLSRSCKRGWAPWNRCGCPPRSPRPPDPVPPAAERKDIQQWTVRLKALIEHLKAVAYERRISPSQLVEELVWKALTDHHPSTL
jgi:hypothetical protein